MGKYLDIIERAAAERVGETRRCDQSDLSDKSTPIGRLRRFGRTLTTLRCRCPDLVPTERWQQAVADGQRFLARWDKQAHALGCDGQGPVRPLPSVGARQAELQQAGPV
jgi:hypothetical protein